MTKLLLFDVDNTLTIARGKITPEMKQMITSVRQAGYHIGCVSGSDLTKLKEQLEESIHEFDWLFTENGLVTYFCHQTTPFSSTSIVQLLGEEVYQQIVNESLAILSQIQLPVKRGTFLELRTGLLNLCPIGRSCSQKEREEFEQYDKQHLLRKSIREKLLSKFGDKIDCSIGGNISLDIFAKGLNKTYCLQFIENKYTEIQFFGDNICEGGNDYEIGIDPRVKPNKVTCWNDTYQLLNNLLTIN
jgi:phosphomannomutase